MEDTTPKVINENNQQEYITEQEARTFRELFRKFLKSYKEKDSSTTNAQWLEYIFRTELHETSAQQAKKDAENYNQLISQLDNEQRILIHDFKNHFVTMKSLIEEMTWLED